MNPDLADAKQNRPRALRGFNMDLRKEGKEKKGMERKGKERTGNRLNGWMYGMNGRNERMDGMEWHGMAWNDMEGHGREWKGMEWKWNGME